MNGPVAGQGRADIGLQLTGLIGAQIQVRTRFVEFEVAALGATHPPSGCTVTWLLPNASLHRGFRMYVPPSAAMIKRICVLISANTPRSQSTASPVPMRLKRIPAVKSYLLSP